MAVSVSERVLRGERGSVPITPAMLRKLERWEENGVSRREMERRTGISLRRIMLVLGRRPERQLGNPRPVWNVYTHRKPWREAIKIAKALGYRITAGENTGEGSVGLMIEAIGNGEAVVLPAAEYQRLLDIEHRMEGLER